MSPEEILLQYVEIAKELDPKDVSFFTGRLDLDEARRKRAISYALAKYVPTGTYDNVEQLQRAFVEHARNFNP